MSAFFSLNPPSDIVDDADPNIQYNGTWNAANVTEIQSESVNFFARMPLFNTLHVLQVFDGSFSYNFAGGGISIFAAPIDNSTFTVKCFLDGNQLSFNANATKAQFGQSQPVCQAFGLPDNAVHMISVVVSVPPRNQQDNNGPLPGFAFDYMLVQSPSGVVPWDNGTQDVFLPVLDRDMRDFVNIRTNTSTWGIVLDDVASTWIANFSLGWEFDPENGLHTTIPGAQFNVTFTGVFPWWYGYSPTQTTSIESSPAAFSIDGGTPSAFTLPSPEQDPSSSQLLLFTIPVLQYATHTLTLAYHSTNMSAPLTLQSILVQKSIPTLTVSVPNSTMLSSQPTTAPNLDTPPPSVKRRNLGSSVGGISGGVVFLLLLVYGVRVLIRWTWRKRHFTQSRTDSTTIVSETFPPPSDENFQTSLPRKVEPGQRDTARPFMQQALQEPPLTKWIRHNVVFNNRHSGLRISRPLIQSDSHIRPPFTNTVSGCSAPREGDTPRQAMPNVVVSTGPLALRGTDEVDSLSEHPPTYTAH